MSDAKKAIKLIECPYYPAKPQNSAGYQYKRCIEFKRCCLYAEVKKWKSFSCEKCRVSRLDRSKEEKPIKGFGRRNFDCESYKKCLDIAVKSNWSSFNCEGCPKEYLRYI